jgi:radical SAM protein with 4Fe4S-binding SPASM domain
LACLHCRAEAQHEAHPDQLSTTEGKALLADIASMGGPTVVILTGGEPLTRSDIYELAEYGTAQGLHMVVSPDDGRLLTPQTVRALKTAGIKRVSFSLHYPTAEENDRFARLPGAFAAALQGLANLREAGLPFQIHTTVMKSNVHQLPALYELICEQNPATWDLFFLVPTGRGGSLQSEVMPHQEYEAALNWLFDLQSISPISIKQTCAPHFRRIEKERIRVAGCDPREVSGNGVPFKAGDYSRRHSAMSRGCMCGNGFVFISHTGEIQGCGYLPLSVGNVRENCLSETYASAGLFQDLRDPDALKGKCGRCEYRVLCGGCRARAYAALKDPLAEEPYCAYQPSR